MQTIHTSSNNIQIYIKASFIRGGKIEALATSNIFQIALASNTFCCEYCIKLDSHKIHYCISYELRGSVRFSPHTVTARTHLSFDILHLPRRQYYSLRLRHQFDRFFESCFTNWKWSLSTDWIIVLIYISTLRIFSFIPVLHRLSTLTKNKLKHYINLKGAEWCHDRLS